MQGSTELKASQFDDTAVPSIFFETHSLTYILSRNCDVQIFCTAYNPRKQTCTFRQTETEFSAKLQIHYTTQLHCSICDVIKKFWTSKTFHHLPSTGFIRAHSFHHHSPPSQFAWKNTSTWSWQYIKKHLQRFHKNLGRISFRIDIELDIDIELILSCF